MYMYLHAKIHTFMPICVCVSVCVSLCLFLSVCVCVCVHKYKDDTHEMRSSISNSISERFILVFFKGPR